MTAHGAASAGDPPAAPVAAAQQPPAPPAQFPPLGTGVSAEERVTLQAAVDRLAAAVTTLKTRYRTGAMVDRVADVEIYLDAVRRPLKYTTSGCTHRRGARPSRPRCGRWPPAASGPINWPAARRRGWPSAVCAVLLADRRLGAALHPDGAGQLRRRGGPTYRLDVFLHGRDDTVLEQQFMAKSTTGYASKPLAAGRRPLHAAALQPLHQRQPVRR